jgi:putative transposase
MADKYKIRLEHVEDLIEVLIAEFNGRPSSGNGYRSPLERLQFFVSQPNVIIPKLNEEKRRRMHLFDYRIARTVRGNLKEGKRPYVQIDGVRYTSDILSQQPELIGKKLALYIDPQDGRFAHSYFSENGSELGLLEAKGYWGRTPHSLETRKAILEGKLRQFEHDIDTNDPIHDYLDQQAKEALEERKTRKKFLKATRGPAPAPATSVAEPHKPRKRSTESKRNVSEEMFQQKVFRV